MLSETRDNKICLDLTAQTSGILVLEQAPWQRSVTATQRLSLIKVVDLALFCKYCSNASKFEYHLHFRRENLSDSIRKRRIF